MKRVWNFVVTMWRPALLFLAVACLLFVLYGFRLGGLTGNMSGAEVATYQDSRSFSAIWDNPVNAPYKIAVHVVSLISTRAAALRLISTGIGILTVVLFYLIARRLFKPWIALGVTALLATSSVMLQATRTLNPSVMLLGLVFLLWLSFLFRYHKATQVSWIIGGVVIGIMLYTPSILFFVLAGAIWQQKRIRSSFEQLTPVTIAITTTILFACFMPIVISLFIEPSLWRQYLGFPAQFASLINIGKSILYVPLSIIGVSPRDPIHWLGRQPILDVVTSVLFIYGLITVIRNHKLDRLWALLGIFIVGTLWVGISDRHSNVIVLIPFVYLIIGMGMQSLLDQWFAVFPRNPLARWTGSIIMLIAIVFSMNFQIIRYYVAWAHNPDTRALYNHKIHK